MIGPGKRADIIKVARVSRSLILCLALFAAPAAAIAQSSLDDPGIGGTGNEPGEGNGIGGTGHPYNRDPRIGGTGIIGTITGFGSILVNGFEVEYSPEQTIGSDLGRGARASDLHVGQVVEVEAEGDGEYLKARTIDLQHAVAGRIDAIDSASGTLIVLGQRVATENSAIASETGDGVRSLSDLKVGDSIEVSGLRRDDGVIAASRIETRALAGPSFIRGRVTAVDNGSFAVSGYRLPLAPDQSIAPPAIGANVIVTGSTSQNRFMLRGIDRVPETPFGGRFKRLSIEGFVGRGPGNALTVGGLPLARRVGAQPRFGDRLIINGPLDKNRHLIPATMQPAHIHFWPSRRGDVGPLREHPSNLQRRLKNNPIAAGSEFRRHAGPQDKAGHAKRWTANRPRWWARRPHRN